MPVGVILPSGPGWSRTQRVSEAGAIGLVDSDRSLTNRRGSPPKLDRHRPGPQHASGGLPGASAPLYSRLRRDLRASIKRRGPGPSRSAALKDRYRRLAGPVFR